MTQEQQLRAQLATYLECWRTNDKDRWLSLFAADAVITDPVGSPPHAGKAALDAFWDRVHQIPMTFHPEMQRAVVCDNEGMMIFRMLSRSEAGPGMAMDIVDTFRFNQEGLIEELKAYWDADCSTMID